MPERDRELVTKILKHNDMTAYRDLVNRHKERTYYLIRRMTGSHEDAEDLMQDTFIKALRTLGMLKDPSKFGGWLNRMAANMVLDFKRRKINDMKVSLNTTPSKGNDGSDKGHLAQPETLSPKLVTTQKDSVHSIENIELKNILDDALAKLPIAHREAFIMFHYQKMSVKEISEYMDCNESTVRSNVFRAVKKLRDYLNDYKELLEDN